MRAVQAGSSRVPRMAEAAVIRKRAVSSRAIGPKIRIEPSPWPPIIVGSSSPTVPSTAPTWSESATNVSVTKTSPDVKPSVASHS